MVCCGRLLSNFTNAETALQSILMLYFKNTRLAATQPTTKALSNNVFKMLPVGKKVLIILDALDKSKTRGDVLL